MKRKKVLIVDDDRHILEILETASEKSGYITLKAMTTLEAKRLVEEEHPDLIILDILLPGELDGLAFCQEIKLDIRYKRIPIILLSGLDEDYYIQEGLKRGAEAYFTKPFSHCDLISKVEDLLKGEESFEDRE